MSLLNPPTPNPFYPSICRIDLFVTHHSRPLGGVFSRSFFCSSVIFGVVLQLHPWLFMFCSALGLLVFLSFDFLHLVYDLGLHMLVYFCIHRCETPLMGPFPSAPGVYLRYLEILVSKDLVAGMGEHIEIECNANLYRGLDVCFHALCCTRSFVCVAFGLLCCFGCVLGDVFVVCIHGFV